MSSKDMYPDWVMDVTHNPPHGDMIFCPVTDEGVMTGLNVLPCPGKIVGAFSEQGQELVDAWWEKNSEWFKAYQAEHNAKVAVG